MTQISDVKKTRKRVNLIIEPTFTEPGGTGDNRRKKDKKVLTVQKVCNKEGREKLTF